MLEAPLIFTSNKRRNKVKEFQHAGALFYDHYDHGILGDVDFYVEEAKKNGSPVLEIGCGTGRVMIPVAEAGVEIVGLDVEPQMLSLFQQKIDLLEDNVRQRLALLEGDMRDFSLPQKFSMVMIPHRAFMHLLTPLDQQKALRNIREHLVDNGYLVFNIVVPHVDEIASHIGPQAGAMQLDMTFTDDMGNEVVSWTSRRYDTTRQHIEQYYIFETLDANGQVAKRAYTPLFARYTHRYEMEHMLSLAGFYVESLYGDFWRRPYHAQGEQVWIARKIGS